MLVKSLRHIKARLGDGKVTYHWACEQLKSVRQDIVVQHIHNAFALETYETHARVALEHGDMKEYNQCQTQVEILHRPPHSLGTERTTAEFAAYRVLYQIYTRHKYGQSTKELSAVLAALRPAVLRAPAVIHARKVLRSIELFDYASFFRLYKSVPNMGVYLLDLFRDFVRHAALQRLTKAFRPSLALSSVRKAVGMLGDACDAAWAEYLKESGAGLVFVQGGPGKVDTKASQPAFAGRFGWAVLEGDNVLHLEEN